MEEQGFQYQKQVSDSVLLAHIIVTLFRRHRTRVLVVCLSLVIHAIEWVHVLLDCLLSRALHLVDEDSSANSMKDEEKGEHPDYGEKPQDKSLSLQLNYVKGLQRCKGFYKFAMAKNPKKLKLYCI